MTDELRGRGADKGLPAYMDLLSHDILNLNQTVLSYIELIATSSELDDRLQEHARKATSQIRISTQIVEGINALCRLQKEDIAATTTDLSEKVDDAAKALVSFVPHRNVRCDVQSPDGDAPVLDARNLVSQAVLNALLNVVQLDPSETPKIDVGIERLQNDEGLNWLVRIHDDSIYLRPDIDLESVTDHTDDSRSRTVRLAGALLSKLMIERLGGSFEMSGSSEEGGTITMRFKGAETR